jgi:hypothetical protein
MTTCLIEFRCPQTGQDVRASAQQRKADVLFESVTCPACTRLHFVDAATGSVFPPTLLGPTSWMP